MPNQSSAQRVYSPEIAPPALIPTPRSLKDAKRRAQAGWLLLTVTGMSLMCAAGIAFEYGHFQLRQETNRQTLLRGQLRSAKERFKELETAKSQQLNPTRIEANAQAIGMIPDNGKETVSFN